MVKYSTAFRKRAVVFLNKINRGETVRIKNTDIRTVRKLCETLGGISSQTIYKWRREQEAKISFIATQKEKLKEVINLADDEQKDYDIQDEIDSIKKPSKTKDVFGLRFYGWYAKNLGIKNYSKMSLKQLKKIIGKTLIDEANGKKTSHSRA